jgi:hypothetical protein
MTALIMWDAALASIVHHPEIVLSLGEALIDNECGAYATGSSGMGWGPHTNEDTAIGKAITECNSVTRLHAAHLGMRALSHSRLPKAPADHRRLGF